MPLIKDAKTTDFLVTKWYLWLPVVLVIVLNGRFGDITLPMERFWFGWYIIFGLSFYLLGNEGKSRSPQAIASGTHFSINHKPYVKGDWAVYTDGIRALMMDFELKKRVLVVPAVFVKTIRDHEIIPVKVRKVDFMDLPAEAQAIIRTYGYEVRDIWFGMLPTKFSDLSIKINGVDKTAEELERIFLQSNYRATVSEDHARGNFQNIETAVSGADRIRKTIEPKTPARRMKEAFGGDDEDDERR